MSEKYWNVRGYFGDQVVDLLVAANTRHRAIRAVTDTLFVERVKAGTVINRMATGDRLILDDAPGVALTDGDPPIDWVDAAPPPAVAAVLEDTP